MNDYRTTYDRWLADPEEFWAEAAQAVDFERPWEAVLDSSQAPSYRWFPGARVNSCYNALDRHVDAGRGDQAALIYDSAMTGRVKTFTYRQLLEEVARLAGAMKARGVGKGDRVIIYMPAVPEAVFAMLACARLGAVHSVVFGGFAARELATRIDDARPRFILSASCGLEPKKVVAYKPLLDEALELCAHKPECCFILQRPELQARLVPGRDLDWNEALQGAEPAPYVPVAATDPLYILYTSGTTGIPKGVVRDNGGHLVALTWSMEHIYGARAGDVFWAASDIGWVVGHSYIVYGPLFAGCTTVLYEGKPVGTPHAGAFWRVIQDHRVNVLFTAPTAFRAIKGADPDAEYLERYDTSSLRSIFLAGERADPATLRWAEEHFGIPVIDHWWQTETGWPVAANCIGLGLMPVKHGSASLPVPGWDVCILDDDGAEVPRGKIGNIVLRLPLPPGSLPTLWQNSEDFMSSYFETFPGYYETGDAGYLDEDGYLYIMSRTDDIINVAGHRLSTGGMEEVLAGHEEVAECAVIGVRDEMKGSIPVGLVVLNSGAEGEPAAVCRELVQRVREHIGPVAAFKRVAVVPSLPKTRSGKVLRATMRKIADGEPFEIPATIDDASVLTDIRGALRNLGYAGLPKNSPPSLSRHPIASP